MQYGEYEIVRYTTTYQDSLLELLALLWGQILKIKWHTSKRNINMNVLLRSIALQPQEVDWQVGGMNLLNLQNCDIRPIYSDTF